MEAVGRLAGGIAYDFNNLLTVIGGFSELLLRRFDPDAPARCQPEKIFTAANDAVALTCQLLAFSRWQVLEPKVLGLNAGVTKMGRVLRRLIGEDSVGSCPGTGERRPRAAGAGAPKPCRERPRCRRGGGCPWRL